MKRCWISTRKSRGSRLRCGYYYLSCFRRTNRRRTRRGVRRKLFLCATRRMTACSVGSKAHQGNSQSPVAESTGRRETEFLQLDEKATLGVVSEPSGRNESERVVAPRTLPRRPSLHKKGEGSTERRRLTEATNRSCGVVSDGTRARTSTATGETLLVPEGNDRRKVGRITGITGKVTERREGGGWVRCSDEGG